MLRPGHIKLPIDDPGNRYTPEELRAMIGEFADCAMHRIRPKRRVLQIA